MLDWLEDEELEDEWGAELSAFADTPLQEPKLSANEANHITKTLASEAATVWLMTGACQELVTFADLFHRPTRQTRAGCRGMDPNLFFPARGESTAAAKAVCAGCEVRGECLDAAMADETTQGIWGGVSQNVRGQMRRGCPRPLLVVDLPVV
jgi:WhiB family transcriptional regulator, redox-sensing transcriptional regulator